MVDGNLLHGQPLSQVEFFETLFGQEVQEERSTWSNCNPHLEGAFSERRLSDAQTRRELIEVRPLLVGSLARASSSIRRR